MSASELKPTGAHVIARTLKDIGVEVIFGLVGIPVIEIAEEAINLGIKFIAFRNEQACGYAAGAYGYVSGKPGVCLVVGGPGVLHAVAGIGNANVNGFPLLVLAGSAETGLVSKGAFQELDAISFLAPHTKFTYRPRDASSIAGGIKNAYRTCWYGRPGSSYIDLPADLIQGTAPSDFRFPASSALVVPPPHKAAGDPADISRAYTLLKNAKAPLVVVGKGAAYARAEGSIREFVDQTGIPFLPTPMGKGVIPDSHAGNTSTARSVALKNADVVLILGARLNWILHYGEAPKWSTSAKFIQVDISAEEIGKNAGDGDFGIFGDIKLVVDQLLVLARQDQWRYHLEQTPDSYLSLLSISSAKNEAKAQSKRAKPTEPNGFLTYQRAFHIIRSVLNSMSPEEEGNIVYVSEGANTMDISRSAFSLLHPRQRLDAGTYATMGVGPGYIIGAHAAFSMQGNAKKIVAFEGDSAFGFSAMEIETLARYKIPALIFVINNSGIYHGDTTTEESWRALQQETAIGTASPEIRKAKETTKGGLRSTSLTWETRYEQLSTMCGGKGHFVKTEKELEEATKEGFSENETVTVVNVIVEQGIGQRVAFGWQSSGEISPTSAIVPTACAIEPGATVSDACVSFADLDALSDRVSPLVQDLTQKTDFFSYYRLNLFNKECPFWTDNNAMCGNRACAVITLDSEDDIPAIWRAGELSKIEGPKAHHPGKKEQDQRPKESPLQGELGENVGESCVLDEDDCDDRDYCVPEDDEEASQWDYVSLVDNPERFTGYSGQGANHVWNAIYRENCFLKQSPEEEEGEADRDHSRAPLQEFRNVLEKQNLQQNVLNAARNIPPRFDDECIEKRVFHRLISGMHASISAHLCWEFFDQKAGEWLPNVTCYKTRLHEYPERISNLYFNFAVVSQAISKLGKTLEGYQYCAGDAAQNAETRAKVLELTSAIYAHPRPVFDESIMFRDAIASGLKDDFRNRFRNVSRLMDCIGCDKCRLWGKLQTVGYGTALKILFEFDPEKGNENPPLRRTEIVALFNTLGRLVKSLNAVRKFEEATVSGNTASLPSHVVIPLDSSKVQEAERRSKVAAEKFSKAVKATGPPGFLEKIRDEEDDTQHYFADDDAKVENDMSVSEAFWEEFELVWKATFL
ncbi:hypothetical protein KEM54_001099, partial [Ascosphaera aggregata]